jgi:hypothetical protein
VLALAKVRTPSKVKPLVRNLAAAHAVDEEDLPEGSAGSSEISRVRDDFQVALAETPYPAWVSSPGRSSWFPGSSATSAVPFHTRGWSSPSFFRGVQATAPNRADRMGSASGPHEGGYISSRTTSLVLCLLQARTSRFGVSVTPGGGWARGGRQPSRYYRESTPNRANSMPYGRNLPVASRPPREAPQRGYSPPPRYQARHDPDRDGRDQIHSVNEDEAEVSDCVPVELETMPGILLPQLRSKNEEGDV